MPPPRPPGRRRLAVAVTAAVLLLQCAAVHAAAPPASAALAVRGGGKKNLERLKALKTAGGSKAAAPKLDPRKRGLLARWRAAFVAAVTAPVRVPLRAVKNMLMALVNPSYGSAAKKKPRGKKAGVLKAEAQRSRQGATRAHPGGGGGG